MSSERTETHDAYYEQARTSPEGLPAEILFNFFVNWKMFDDEIDEINAKKKAAIEIVRCRFGKHQARPLKAAMTVMRKDVRQRAEDINCNDLAARYVELIESEFDAREIRA